MQQKRKNSAALLLCVVLVIVCGCGGYSNTPDYRYYEYKPGYRIGSDLPVGMFNPTQVVDELTQEANSLLARGDYIGVEPLINLNAGANDPSPLHYSYGSGNIFQAQSGMDSHLSMHSSTGYVSFAVFNFDELPPSQFISYVEVIGNADFLNWRNEGFFFGIRQAGQDKFSWSGPVSGSQNWIFSYSLHEGNDYNGGIPSIVVGVADGDRLRIKGLRVVVSNVEDYERRFDGSDPHYIWPFTANQFYDPSRVPHFYNGRYGGVNNSDYRYVDPWYDDDYSTWGRDIYWENEFDSVSDNLYDERLETERLLKENDDLRDLIKEQNTPFPKPVTPTYQAPAPPDKQITPPETTTVVEAPVLRTVPVV